MRLRLSSRALEDIADIRDYLLPRSPQGAENVRRAIIEDFDLLEQFRTQAVQPIFPASGFCLSYATRT